MTELFATELLTVDALTALLQVILIDLVLAGGSVAKRVRAAWVDRQARKGSGPSDHAPVIIDLDEAPDGDIGPVIPPPSAPAPREARSKLPQSQLTPSGE